MAGKHVTQFVHDMYLGVFLCKGVESELMIPLCSNPFCKWFWSGFGVPKHLLKRYLEH